MSVDRFRFVSPGVFINEIDRSQLPRQRVIRTGPAIIGRAERGPAMKPVLVNSFQEFVETFGNPIAGGKGGDVWSEGNYAAPTYGAFAAQAYLANDAPVNFIRLLGDQSDDPNSAISNAKAGWNINDLSTTEGVGVYGLWILNSASFDATARASGSLAAMFYVTSSANILLSGTTVGGATGSDGLEVHKAARGTARLLTTVSNAGSQEFKIMITDSSDAVQVAATFNFDRTSGRYIRKVFNTNPQLANSNITPSANREKYWLGESFDRNMKDLFPGYGTDVLYGVLLGLGSGSTKSCGQFRTGFQKPQTPPIVAQADGEAVHGRDATFNVNNTPKELFTCIALDSAEWTQNNIKISIVDVKVSPNPDYEPYGTFGLQVRKMTDTDTVPQILEQFNSLNLNPNSPQYVARRIGNMFSVWNTTLRKYRDYGEYPSNSKYIRIEMANGWTGTPSHLLPFGYKGVPKWIGFNYRSGSNVFNPLNLTSSLGTNDVAFNTGIGRGSGSIYGAGAGYSGSTVTSATNVQHELSGSGLVAMALTYPSTLLGATAVDCIDTDGYVNSNADASFTISIPTSAGGLGGTAVTILLDENQNGGQTGAANTINVGTFDGSETDALAAGYIIDALNGETDARIVYATSGNGQSGDDLGITAAQGSSNTQITLTMDTAGASGNITSALASVTGHDIIDVTAFTEGGTVSQVRPTGSFQFPVLPVRMSGSDGGLSDSTNAYWGFNTTPSRTSLAFEPSVREHLRVRPDEFDRTDPDSDSFLERGPGFTLDDLVWDAKFSDVYHSGSAFGQNNQVAYAQTPPVCPEGPGGDVGSVQLGSYAAGTSCNAVSSSYSQILSMGYDRFTVPLFGAFDGLDIKEAEPFNNTRALGGEETAAPNERDNAMYYTVKKAIDTIGDVEVIDTNLLALPGVTVRGLTSHALTVAEDRADTLAVIDLEAGYTSSYENTDSFTTRGGSVAGTVSAVKDRAFNNSYGACYYPWVRIVDSLSGQQIWMPPSVVALGTYASSARRSELWFAPAGFNRGGLSRGAAGFPVVGVIEKLTSKERDNLYEVNVNPIASFPAEGIVVFGQKTLQATPSALDRVNVRRLLCYLKKQISRIANNILFDPNTQVTWDRFLGRVNPLLRSVKSRFGLTEYRVILDTSTTTPDLVDRNIMYAKVFLKPTRAIEFIALDFIITRTGASFDD